MNTQESLRYLPSIKASMYKHHNMDHVITQAKEENHTLGGKKYTDRMTESKWYLRDKLKYHILYISLGKTTFISIYTLTKAWNLRNQRSCKKSKQVKKVKVDQIMSPFGRAT